MLTYLKARFGREAGASMVEYSLLIAFLAILVAASISEAGQTIRDLYFGAADEL